MPLAVEWRRLVRGPRGLVPLASLAVLFCCAPARAIDSASGRIDLESWLFVPGTDMAGAAIAIGLWIAWHRRRRLRLLPHVASPLLAGICCLAALTCFAWSRHIGSSDLLLLSFSLQLLAVGAALRGPAGLRSMTTPALVIGLGIRMPDPLGAEWVWRLQLQTARDVAWLLGAIGHEISQAGVLLWSDRVSFHVIEGCSGFRGIRILVFVALVIRELLPGRARVGLVVAIAPLVAYALNVARVAVIVLGDPGDAARADEGEHLLQGVLILVAGTAVLYLAGWWLARGAPADSGARAATRRELPWLVSPQPALRGVLVVALVQLLAAVTVPGRRADARTSREAVSLPASGPGWTSERLSPGGQDLFFYSDVPWERVVHRRFREARRPRSQVDVFVVPGAPGDVATSKHFSSRIRTPGADFRVIEAGPKRIWGLGMDAELILLARGESAEPGFVAYTWRVRDCDAWRAALFTLLAPGASCDPSGRLRRVVRVMTTIEGRGPLALDRARKTLDRFVEAFAGDFEAI